MRTVLYLLIVLLFSVSYSCTSDVKPIRPNILFIPVDDLRPDLGCYGNETVVTPNIDKVANEGVTFNRAYCQQAVCNPSRVSLLTGLRPDTLKVWDLRTEFRKNLPDVVTLPQHFKDNGYYVYGIGKIFHNIYPDTISWSEKPHVDGFPFDPDAVYLNEDNVARQEERNRNTSTRVLTELISWDIGTLKQSQQKTRMLMTTPTLMVPRLLPPLKK